MKDTLLCRPAHLLFKHFPLCIPSIKDSCLWTPVTQRLSLLPVIHRFPPFHTYHSKTLSSAQLSFKLFPLHTCHSEILFSAHKSCKYYCCTPVIQIFSLFSLIPVIQIFSPLNTKEFQYFLPHFLSKDFLFCTPVSQKFSPLHTCHTNSLLHTCNWFSPLHMSFKDICRGGIVKIPPLHSCHSKFLFSAHLSFKNNIFYTSATLWTNIKFKELSQDMMGRTSNQIPATSETSQVLATGKLNLVMETGYLILDPTRTPPQQKIKYWNNNE